MGISRTKLERSLHSFNAEKLKKLKKTKNSKKQSYTHIKSDKTKNKPPNIAICR